MQVILNAQTYKATLEQQCEQGQVARQGDKDALQHVLVLPLFLVKPCYAPRSQSLLLSAVPYCAFLLVLCRCVCL